MLGNAALSGLEVSTIFTSLINLSFIVLLQNGNSTLSD